ncbi:MAG TPA: cell envelope integrity protein TolA [Rubrivivax sp.]
MSTASAPPPTSLLPRAPGGNTEGAALALLVHAGLIAALAYGVAWRLPAPDVVSAELWAALPQTAAPRAAEPTPAPAPAPPPPPPITKAPAPVPAPAPAPPPKATLPDPQIAIEKARKEEAAKLEQAEREKALQAKAARERAERAEREKAEKAAKDKAEREAAAAEDKRLAQQREENLKRMLGQIASSPGGRGSAVADAAPSASYAGRIVRAIKPNIVLTDTISGNPAAEVEVRAAPNGGVIGRRLLKSSGSPEWDEAVLRAIDRTETLPRDTDGRVPATLVISFRPRD